MDQAKHIDMLSSDGAQFNLDALYKIAPSCFTEAKGEDGTIRKVVDFAKLRLLLGDNAVEDTPEVYDFTWVESVLLCVKLQPPSGRPFALVRKNLLIGIPHRISISRVTTLKY